MGHKELNQVSSSGGWVRVAIAGTLGLIIGIGIANPLLSFLIAPSSDDQLLEAIHSGEIRGKRVSDLDLGGLELSSIRSVDDKVQVVLMIPNLYLAPEMEYIELQLVDDVIVEAKLLSP